MSSYLKDGYRQPPSRQLGRDDDRPVWIVFLRGDMHVPNRGVPPVNSPWPVQINPPPTYHQMIVIFDASTGEFRQGGFRPLGREIAAADGLPNFPMPTTKPSIELPRVLSPPALPT